MTTTTPRWLLCRARRPAAPMRLYCFAHSGGSVGEYLRWADLLPDVEVLGVQLPGRGSRSGEEPCADLRRLVPALVDAVDFTGPYAFFGHSLGALVAYETARELRRRGCTGPDRLILSAYAAPHLRAAAPPVPADDHDLIAAVEAAHGPLPAQVHADAHLRALTVGVLRADMSLVDTYAHRPECPLDCPMTVLGGVADSIPADDLRAWQQHTIAACWLRLFDGDHFYFREQLDDVLHYLAAQLRDPDRGDLPGSGALGPAAALR